LKEKLNLLITLDEVEGSGEALLSSQKLPDASLDAGQTAFGKVLGSAFLKT
jgi:hypothetical protein